MRLDRDWIEDILESIANLAEFTKTGRETFLADLKTQRAVVCELQIIGEATKNTSEALKAQYPQIPWRQMARTRDRLIHGYHTISPQVVWRIPATHLQKLPAELQEIFNRLPS